MSNLTLLNDRFNRNINYLRISITDRCNLQCTYCNPHNLVPKLTHEGILSYEELLRIIRVAVRLGISKIRVTGGEPLVRKGVYHFLKEIVAIEGIKDVSLTTNGVLLKDNIKKIKQAGIKRINVSLDSLNRQNFEKITRRDLFSQVWEGIEAARSEGFDPIKLNVVAIRGQNDHEFQDIARLSFDYPFHIRFIEYMPMGDAAFNKLHQILTPEIKKRLRNIGKLIRIPNLINDGPARRYRFKGAIGEIGFISAISRHFCHDCNRLRLTASGALRACLLSDRQTDIKGPLRSGCSDLELARIFMHAIYLKPTGHRIAKDHDRPVNGKMFAIGG
ncbi:GTP 3',8-cyclase MoaA [Desulfococcaceae bacterium HSG7]|nr:GTP 3',8-cyclase MoaA [Desulfococcaceae bacterium HSG7]